MLLCPMTSNAEFHYLVKVVSARSPQSKVTLVPLLMTHLQGGALRLWEYPVAQQHFNSLSNPW